MKKKYVQTMMKVYRVEVESALLDFTGAGTHDPKEAGDATGTNGKTPNPFKSIVPQSISDVWQQADNKEFLT